MFDEESKRRRDILARRPSYRKILNDLSSAEAASNPVLEAAAASAKSNDEHQEQNSVSAAGLTAYLKMVPSGTIQIGSNGGTSIQGIPTIMTNANAGNIVQYASANDGQFIIPGKCDSSANFERIHHVSFLQLTCKLIK